MSRSIEKIRAMSHTEKVEYMSIHLKTLHHARKNGIISRDAYRSFKGAAIADARSGFATESALKRLLDLERRAFSVGSEAVAQ